MVAFKYIVSGKLPDINYATWIDYYVLFCFVVEFLVVGLQFCSVIGFIDETVYQYQVNATGVRASPAADQNKTACSSESGCVVSWSSSGSVISTRAVRTVQISMHAVWIIGTWLAMHILAILGLIVWHLHRQSQFYSWSLTTPNVIWVGPVNFAHDNKDDVHKDVLEFMEGIG